MTFFEELEYRGLVNDITSPELVEKINNGGLTFYIGVDPTGDSLHIGHYQSVIAMTKRLLEHGHKPIIIAGGGTGLIGDPKPNVERPMISKEQVAHNIECIKKQISKIMGEEITIVNNADWLLEMNAVDFLRDFGKHFNINYMINKDTVKRRLDIGITYTEFSYMILQSIDFLKLYEKYGVTMQIGGQDQWGNITAGIELIRKIHGAECYGLTIPLVTKADGTKFGKSEGKNVWLDPKKSSPYEFYQFFVNVADSDIANMLKRLSMKSVDEIKQLIYQSETQPHLREAQKALAMELTEIVHGKEGLQSALRITDALFKGNIADLTADEISQAFKDAEKTTVSENTSLIDALLQGKVCSSKREAREFITSGSISINGNKCQQIDKVLTLQDTLDGKTIVIRKGKKNYSIFNI